MDQKIKELWIIPIIIAVSVGLVLGLMFMIWGAWYSGIQLHSPLSFVWLSAVFTTQIPMWFLLLIVAFGSLVLGLYRRQIARTRFETNRNVALEGAIKQLGENQQELNERHAAEIRRLSSPEPVLHMSWQGTSHWWWVELGAQPIIRIGGDVLATVDNIKETVTLTNVRIEGAEFVGNLMPFKIEPGETIEKYLSLPFRGLSPEPNRPLTVKLLFEDLKGRIFEIRPVTFHASSSHPAASSASHSSISPSEISPTSPSGWNVESRDSAMNTELIATSDDDFSCRIYKFQSDSARGIMLIVNNNRLDPIEKIRIVILNSQSFDSRHSQFRQSSNFNAVSIVRPEVIQPSSSAKQAWLVRKDVTGKHLMAGDSTQPMPWPDNDHSAVQKWRLSIQIDASTVPRNALERAFVLKSISKNIVVLWNKAENKFSVMEE